MVFSILRHVVKQVKGRVFVSFDADGSWGPIVSSPNLLFDVLVWIHKRPDAVESLINYYTSSAIESGTKAIEYGADAILMCVDYGNLQGPWMSPTMFRRFVKPALARQVNAFKKRGAFTVLHSDGNVLPILQDIVETGVDAYQGIDVMAGMDLDLVKRRFGKEICLIGNVDPRIIEFGTREEVSNEVDRCLSQGASGGGFILSTSANISVNTNTENFLYMLELTKKRGKY
jgi:uroporphyrinogen decarboxylase